MSSATYTYKMTEEDIKNLIRLRTTNGPLFTRRRNAAKSAWSVILTEMGLEDKVTVDQIAKKWENLKTKYKEIKFPPPGMEAIARTSQWRWFKLMDEALKEEFPQSNFNSLMSSVSDDEGGPQPKKRICQVKVGGDILELLVDEERVSGVRDSGSSLMGQSRLLDEDTATDPANVDIERARVARERELLEKEHADMDRERLTLEREKDMTEREKTSLLRDRAQLEKDRAAMDRDRALLEQDRARLEKDRATLERDKAELVRDRQTLNAMIQGENATGCSLDNTHEKNREKLILLFEKLIEKF